MFLLLLTAFIAGIIIWGIKQFVEGRNQPPGPMGFPIIGSLLDLNSEQAHKNLTDLAGKYGKIYRLRMGSINTIVLTDTNLIREAFRREEFTGRAPLYLTHGIMKGYGLICSEGALWKDQRKASINFLKSLGMSKYSENRNSLESRITVQANECVKTIQKALEKRPDLDLMQILHHNLGNLINDIVFGVKYTEDDETWQYLQKLQEEGVKYMGISAGINFLPFLRFLPSNQKIINYLFRGQEKSHAIYADLIKTAENSDANKNTILRLYLEERKKRLSEADPSVEYCSDTQLKFFLSDLYGAGVDTTLTTIRWILLYIGRDDKIMANIREEMNKKLVAEPTLDDMESMPYLRACIAEGQRIRSVVPTGIPHGTRNDTELDGFKIPKNSMIIPLQWAIHMDPAIWPKPEKYNPERFIDENGDYFVPPNFIPFQTGKRMCLGDELAKMIMFIFVSRILYNFDIKLDNADAIDMTGHCGITLTPLSHKFLIKKCN